eukprot:2749624-Rhodomonas_salina.3
MARSSSSPLTRERLDSTLHPNFSLRNSIATWGVCKVCVSVAQQHPALELSLRNSIAAWAYCCVCVCGPPVFGVGFLLGYAMCVRPHTAYAFTVPLPTPKPYAIAVLHPTPRVTTMRYRTTTPAFFPSSCV